MTSATMLRRSVGPGRRRGVEVIGRFELGLPALELIEAGATSALPAGERALVGWADEADPTTLPLASLARAKGQWAMIRSDAGRLEAAVDELASVPLYWIVRRDVTLVSTHLPLLLDHLGEAARPNVSRALEWIAWSFSDPIETLFEQIKIVPPGSALVADERGPRLERYGRLRAHLDNGPSREDWVGRLRAGLRTSLRRQLPHEPYALLLSGGLDSSMLAAAIVANEELPRPRVAASLRYPGLPSDESAYQDAVLQRTGFASLVIEPQPFDPDRYVDRIRSSATPVHVAAPETDELYRVLRAEGIEVAVDGAGGDELFSPLRWGVEELLLQGRWSTLARWWRTQGWRGIPRGLRLRMALANPPGLRSWRTARHRSPLIPSDAARRHLGRRLLPPRSLPARHATGRARARYLTSAMVMVGRSIDNDQSRASDIELRSPLLDIDLVKLALSIPEAIRHAGDDPRWLQRQAFADHLPPELLARRDKVHFDYRYAQHLQHPWVRDQLASSHLAEAGLLDRQAVLADYDALAAQVRSDITRLPATTGPLWHIVALETWWRHFVS